MDEVFAAVRDLEGPMLTFYDYDNRGNSYFRRKENFDEVVAWCRENGIKARHISNSGFFTEGIFILRENDPYKLLLFKMRWI